MKTQKQIKHDGNNCQADGLTDLSMTDEQAEETKGGVRGGDGRDVLIGGWGQDWISGGTGRD
jgi:hypothetical protein